MDFDIFDLVLSFCRCFFFLTLFPLRRVLSSIVYSISSIWEYFCCRVCIQVDLWLAKPLIHFSFGRRLLFWREIVNQCKYGVRFIHLCHLMNIDGSTSFTKPVFDRKIWINIRNSHRELFQRKSKCRWRNIQRTPFLFRPRLICRYSHWQRTCCFDWASLPRWEPDGMHYLVLSDWIKFFDCNLTGFCTLKNLRSGMKPCGDFWQVSNSNERLLKVQFL